MIICWKKPDKFTLLSKKLRLEKRDSIWSRISLLVLASEGHSKRKWISFYTSSLHNLHINLFFLKIEIWSSEPLVYDLKYYWNVQVLELIHNPFPLDINCNKTIINLVRVWYDGLSPRERLCHPNQISILRGKYLIYFHIGSTYVTL